MQALRLAWALLFLAGWCLQAECKTEYVSDNQVDYGPIVVRSISGYVLDFQSVRIPDACVVLFDEQRTVVASTVSGSDGAFRLERVHRGDYRLVVKVDGLSVANARVRVMSWPHGGVWRESRLTAQMLPRGMDVASSIKLR